MDKEYGVVLDVDLTLFKAKMEEASLIAKKVSAETQGVTGNLNLNVDTSGIQSSLDGLKDKIVEIKDEFQRVNAQNIKNTLSTNTGNQGLFSNLFFSNARSGLGILRTIGTTLKFGIPIAIGIGLIGKIANYFKTKAEEAKKRIENLKQVFLNVFNAIGNGAKRVLSMAVGYIENFFNKALNSYMSFDQQLTKNIQSVWVGFGSFMAPILEYIISLFQRLLAYVNAMIKVFTGVDFIARANAKAMNGVAGATAKATKALAGFDELQNIERESGGGGGISGGGIEIPDVDTSNIESFAQKIKKMIEEDDWFSVGTTVRDKIIKALENINWGEIKVKAEEIGRKLAQFLNGLFKPNEDGKTLGAILGNTLANAINTALIFLDSFLTTIDTVDFAQNIVDLIVHTIEGIDWNKATDVLQKMADALLKLLSSSLETLEKKLPEWMEKIKAYFEGEKGRKLLETIAQIIVKWEGLRETLKQWFEDLVKYIYQEYQDAQKKIEAKAKAEPIIKNVEKWLEIPETSEIGKKNQATLKKRIEEFRKNVGNMSSSEVTRFYNDLKRDLDKAKKGTDLETGLVDFNKVQDNIKNGFGNLQNSASSDAKVTINKTASTIKDTIEEESGNIQKLNYTESAKSFESYNDGVESVDLKSTIDDKFSEIQETNEGWSVKLSAQQYGTGNKSWESYNDGTESVDINTPAEEKADDFLKTLLDSFGISGDKSLETQKIGHSIGNGLHFEIENTDLNTPASKISQGMLDTFNTVLGITGEESTETKELGEKVGKSLNKGMNNSDAINKSKDYFNKVFNAIATPLDNTVTKTDASGKNMGSSLGLGIQTAFNGVIGGALSTVRNGLNNVIGLFNKSADNIGRNYNIKIKGSIANGVMGAGNIAQDVISNVIASVRKIPFLSIGTNEVYSEGLAYLHTGEKVVPANVAKGGYDSSDNKETNMLLRVLIDTLENKDFNATIGKDEVGRASVDYINKMKRITGGAIV